MLNKHIGMKRNSSHNPKMQVVYEPTNWNALLKCFSLLNSAFSHLFSLIFSVIRTNQMRHVCLTQPLYTLSMRWQLFRLHIQVLPRFSHPTPVLSMFLTPKSSKTSKLCMDMHLRCFLQNRHYVFTEQPIKSYCSNNFIFYPWYYY